MPLPAAVVVAPPLTRILPSYPIIFLVRSILKPSSRLPAPLPVPLTIKTAVWDPRDFRECRRRRPVSTIRPCRRCTLIIRGLFRAEVIIRLAHPRPIRIILIIIISWVYLTLITRTTVPRRTRLLIRTTRITTRRISPIISTPFRSSFLRIRG